VGDVPAMVEFALDILDDANLERFKTNALERAKLFDIKNILPLYEAYYEEIINLHKSALLV
jgi:hypothetical protein